MLYLFIIYFLICIYKISFKNVKVHNQECLSIESTTAINGIFVIMIVFSHFNQYVNYTSGMDIIYQSLLNKIGQLMVTTFFFYSGYGIYESIKKKGDSYIKGFMKNRFLKVFISFVVAIILFMIINLILGNDYSIYKYLLAFIGLESVGNSNWFIFATLVLYLITYIVFRYIKRDNFSNILMITIGIFIYIILMNKLGYQSFWYNTILCYSGGMLLSYFKDNLWNFLKINLHYFIVLILTTIIFYLSYDNNLISYHVCTLSFCMLIFLLTYKIKVGNKILLFFGRNAFNIYILQRIPMMILSRLDINIYAYFIISFVLTIILAFLFNKLVKLILKTFRIA